MSFLRILTEPLLKMLNKCGRSMEVLEGRYGSALSMADM